VHPKGANSMAASGLIFRSDLVGTGRAISIVFSMAASGLIFRSDLVGTGRAISIVFGINGSNLTL